VGGNGQGVDKRGRSPLAGLVLVNGGPTSIQGPRARAFFEGGARIVYKTAGRLGSVPVIARAIHNQSTGWIYCIDQGVPGAVLAFLLKGSSVRLIYELGDPAAPLLANQSRPRWEVLLADWMDRKLPRRADGLVFRGTYLREYFKDLASGAALPPSEWIPDGVDTELFRPVRESAAVKELRARWGLDGAFVVGIVGSVNYSPRFDLYYGWELTEALGLLTARKDIIGVVVGDGPGMPKLKARIAALHLDDRVRLVGRVAHDQVPLWINAFDVALSTQTDDPVGWARTTAKLPEYLACGTVVICSDVGEAHRILSASGQTLPYRGMRDPEYPALLATKVEELEGMELSALRVWNRELAVNTFDYRLLRAKVASFVQSLSRDTAS
jgi:glycosyltransferase involved in cell wall biosynthesis